MWMDEIPSHHLRNHEKPLFVRISGGILIPFLRWCRILSIHRMREIQGHHAEGFCTMKAPRRYQTEPSFGPTHRNPPNTASGSPGKASTDVTTLTKEVETNKTQLDELRRTNTAPEFPSFWFQVVREHSKKFRAISLLTATSKSGHRFSGNHDGDIGCVAYPRKADGALISVGFL